VVGLLDGKGGACTAIITSLNKSGSEVAVRVDGPRVAAREPRVALTVVHAVLKGDKMDDVIRDAVMLGVAAVQPIVTKRTESTVAALMKGTRVERWRRVALASVKQSRRAMLPEIRMPLTLETYLGDPPAALRVMLVEPSANDGASSLSVLQQQPTPHDATLLVGPEGGWTAEECAAAARAGVQLVTLGGRTLRADAVPVAAISVLQFLWNDL
jgi:16S rRNA (uracil1498-N3)-methyltransferase